MKEYKSNIKRDKIYLWQYLNLNENFYYKDADGAYLKTKKNKKTQFAWKVLRDKYFCSEYKKNKSISRIFEAGFFDDEQDIGFYKNINYQWAKTPVYKIKTNIKKFGRKKRYAVLLTTGAFSPIHKGHIL